MATSAENVITNAIVSLPTEPDRPVVAYAWPTGRPVYPYTPADIAEGVDVYTRYLKRRNNVESASDHDAA